MDTYKKVLTKVASQLDNYTGNRYYNMVRRNAQSHGSNMPVPGYARNPVEFQNYSEAQKRALLTSANIRPGDPNYIHALDYVNQRSGENRINYDMWDPKTGKRKLEAKPDTKVKMPEQITDPTQRKILEQGGYSLTHNQSNPTNKTV
jgi:hypothetical protein